MEAGPDEGEERYQRALVHAALRNVVHDLNNPLGTITMAAAALRTATDDTQRAELIDLIEREAMRAGATTRTAAERSAVPSSSQAVPLADVLAAAQERCRAAGVDVVFDPPPAGLSVTADAALLARAVAAFVADAHRSPGRRMTVRVETRVDADHVEVAVHDDGEVVAPERARRPFRPFAADGSTEGRAVGLAVAAGRHLVRSLGGSLDLVPGPDAGNIVWLRLPVAPPVTGPDAAATAREAEVPAARRVLVVDDDRTMRNMLEVVLGRDGWTTTVAADGRAAVSAVGGEPVDLVLLDLHVGAEYGPDIAADLEQQRPGVGRRVVYLSGDVPSSGRIDGRPAIAKPFVLEELYRVADAVAADREPL